jgi:hypothetical protein
MWYVFRDGAIAPASTVPSRVLVGDDDADLEMVVAVVGGAGLAGRARATGSRGAYLGCDVRART